jgi:hypothetical protein
MQSSIFHQQDFEWQSGYGCTRSALIPLKYQIRFTVGTITYAMAFFHFVKGRTEDEQVDTLSDSVIRGF